jgi:hypothetical protein
MHDVISPDRSKNKAPQEISKTEASSSPSIIPDTPTSLRADTTALASQRPLTPAAVAIRDTLLEQELSSWDEFNGFDGDREEINNALYAFEDEVGCIVNILKTPPLDQHIELLSAGWRCVFPLIANGACSVSYALNRCDKIVRAAKLDLAIRQRARAVELILMGPPA